MEYRNKNVEEVLSEGTTLIREFAEETARQLSDENSRRLGLFAVLGLIGFMTFSRSFWIIFLCVVPVYFLIKLNQRTIYDSASRIRFKNSRREISAEDYNWTVWAGEEFPDIKPLVSRLRDGEGKVSVGSFLTIWITTYSYFDQKALKDGRKSLEEALG